MSILKGKQLKAIGVVLLMLVLGASANQRPVQNTGNNNDPAEKKKTINRSFSVSSSDKLKIENSFGNVEIKTWDKNEFKVNITITTRAGSESEAQRLLDAIEIKEKHTGGVYAFETDINNKGNNNKDGKSHKGRDHKEFSIDYEVYMPTGNPMEAENSFGNLVVGDRNGETTLASRFGNLEAGKIASNNGITTEYGEATIASLSGGKATFQFSGDVKIANLEGDVKVVAEYSDASLTLSSGLKALNLVNSFSHVRLNVPPGLPVALSANCKFGEFQNKTSYPLKEIEDEDNRYSMEKSYECTSGDGSVKIKIKTNFGEVRIMNPGDKDEPKEKGRKKEKGQKV